MVRKTAAILGIVFLAQSLWAETTYTFLVYLGKINLDLIENRGKTGQKQPLFETRVLASPNTNYALVQITPNTVADKTALTSFEGTSRILKIKEDTVIEEMVRGELVTTRTTRTFNELPEDYYKVWASSK